MMDQIIVLHVEGEKCIQSLLRRQAALESLHITILSANDIRAAIDFARKHNVIKVVVIDGRESAHHEAIRLLKILLPRALFFGVSCDHDFKQALVRAGCTLLPDDKSEILQQVLSALEQKSLP